MVFGQRELLLRRALRGERLSRREAERAFRIERDGRSEAGDGLRARRRQLLTRRRGRPRIGVGRVRARIDRRRRRSDRVGLGPRRPRSNVAGAAHQLTVKTARRRIPCVAVQGIGRLEPRRLSRGGAPERRDLAVRERAAPEAHLVDPTVELPSRKGEVFPDRQRADIGQPLDPRNAAFGLELAIHVQRNDVVGAVGGRHPIPASGLDHRRRTESVLGAPRATKKGNESGRRSRPAGRGPARTPICRRCERCAPPPTAARPG